MVIKHISFISFFSCFCFLVFLFLFAFIFTRCIQHKHNTGNTLNLKKSGQLKVKERKFVWKLSSEILQSRPIGITFFQFYFQDQPDLVRCLHQARPVRFHFQKSGKEKCKEWLFHTTKKIQLKKYNTHTPWYSDLKKISIRFAFWRKFGGIAPFPTLKCKKALLKSLIRHIYILGYIVIKTNRYIVMHALRGSVVLRSA